MHLLMLLRLWLCVFMQQFTGGGDQPTWWAYFVQYYVTLFPVGPCVDATYHARTPVP